MCVVGSPSPGSSRRGEGAGRTGGKELVRLAQFGAADVPAALGAACCGEGTAGLRFAVYQKGPLGCRERLEPAQQAGAVRSWGRPEFSAPTRRNWESPGGLAAASRRGSTRGNSPQSTGIPAGPASSRSLARVTVQAAPWNVNCAFWNSRGRSERLSRAIGPRNPTWHRVAVSAASPRRNRMPSGSTARFPDRAASGAPSGPCGIPFRRCGRFRRCDW